MRHLEGGLNFNVYQSVFIFLVKDGQFIVWDYLHHKQFSLEPEHADRLRLWSSGNVGQPSPLDNELEDAHLIAKEPFEEVGEWGWDELSKIYHIGTKNISDNLMTLSKEDWIENYLTYCQSISSQPPTFHIKKEGNTVSLPQPNLSLLDKNKFLEVMRERKTCRSFKGEAISFDQLSTLLYVSLGPIHEKWSDLEDNGLQILGRRKSFPSAGGLHPEEAYIIALRVDGLIPGIYHYDSVEHHLTLVEADVKEEDLVKLLYGQYFAEGLSFGIFLTARFEKGWWKYPHSRGYRVVLLDIGHASQSILLTATALGLETWLTGAFGDTQTEKFLNLTSSTEQPILFIGGGYGDKGTVDPYILGELRKNN
ncbi:SagB/ThcOx family dehydrogenase [Candidatus Paracaedibacter symbiosus]|uniref:SagB/ThcOx family dehydrogenase n=1 Tax=Candidatus Paracaedibacter symbiosus TaxID=244582 RepID=UPI00068E9364|nr:SagB/ThcOx family dehydrogenase [Candidatus Paracaedibacter symbiosus]